MPFRDLLEQIERHRRSRALIVASSHIELGLLAPLHDALTQVGRCERLDVVFYSRGGVVNAARRLALLLRDFAAHVSFLVPHYCESAGTIAALSADEIVAGPVAIFSPIDPLLSANGRGGGPAAVSVQDLRLFGEMASHWFGLERQEADARALSVLCDSIFPSTLTSFYRSTLEVQDVCAELLALHVSDEQRAKGIADRLIFGFHSHTYALTRGDLEHLGLPVRREPEVESAMWTIAARLRTLVGRGACGPADDEWVDALIATRQGALARWRAEDFVGRWQDWKG